MKALAIFGSTGVTGSVSQLSTGISQHHMQHHKVLNLRVESDSQVIAFSARACAHGVCAGPRPHSVHPCQDTIKAPASRS